MLVLCFFAPTTAADTLYRSFDDARALGAIDVPRAGGPASLTMLIDGVTGRALTVTTGQPTWSFAFDREPASGADHLQAPNEANADWLIDFHLLACGIPAEPTRVLTIGNPARADRAFAVISIEPTGAWSATLCDGAVTQMYEATVPRQLVADSQWHRIRVHIDRANHLVRFYWNDSCVAMYDLHAFGSLHALGTRDVVTVGDWRMRGAWYFAIDELRIEHSHSIAPPVVDAIAPLRAMPSAARDEVRILTWNLRHGGREDGPDIGVNRVIEIIEGIDPDIICLQESFGSGARIADALGFLLYRSDASLTIMSRFPITEVIRPSRSMLYACAQIALDDQRLLRIVNVSLHHLPDYWTAPLPEGATAEALFAGELPTRVVDMATILRDLAPAVASAGEVPIIVAGAFNSASHLDWTLAQRGAHDGLVVKWPVSRMMMARGFIDVFRQMYPDAGATPGRTWSPRWPSHRPERLDYIYMKGLHLQSVAAAMHDQHRAQWPSDHAAVSATFRWGGNTAAR